MVKRLRTWEGRTRALRGGSGECCATAVGVPVMVSQVITEDLIEGIGSRLRLGGFLMALRAFVFFFLWTGWDQ